MRYFLEGGRIGSSPLSRIEALRGIAILKSSEGYNKSSLRDLENLYPLYRYAPAHIYLDYLNSLAVELGEANRIQEAKNISRIVLASPYAFAYPEWRETGQEIALRGYRLSRSVVSLAKRTPRNILELPKREAAEGDLPPGGKASVISLDNWKKKMGKKAKNGEDEKLPDNMNSADMVVMMMNLMSDKEKSSEEKLRKVLKYALKVFYEK